MDGRQILVQRVAAAPRKPLDALAHVVDRRQIVGPQIVDGAERNQPFEIGRTRLLTGQDGLAKLLDLLPLALNYTLVFLQESPNLQVLPFRDALNALDVLAFTAVLHQQIVLDRDKELRASRIALPPGSPAQLVVNPSALVTISPDDVQSAQLGYAGPEPDVGSASGHVG